MADETYTEADAETGDEKPSKKAIKQPDDFDTPEAFLEYIRECVRDDLFADKHNRDPGIEDAQFVVGDQWDPTTRAAREQRRKPVLTENYLPAFVGQVTGNRRLNNVDIKVAPDNGGTKERATIREGIIRNIQKNSISTVAVNTATLNQVVSGIGNFKVELEYAYDDVFDQDIKIKQIPNPFNVVWDRMSVDPTGADARWVTEFSRMSAKDFAKEYPDAQPADLAIEEDTRGLLTNDGWYTAEDVRVAAYWRLRYTTKRLVMLIDGTVKEEKLLTPEQQQAIMMYDDGTPVARDAQCKYWEMYLVSGMDLLEGPYRLPISTPPIFRVPGWELSVGEKRHRWGLIRFLKDPQRLHNYWVSVKAEKYTQAPRATWTARANAVQGREKEWRESAHSDDPLLIFNDDAAEAPSRTDPIPIEQALIEAGASSLQTLRDVSNIHEASLGQQSNEVSGKAIMARQRVGELGSVLYNDNGNLAEERCGRVINELIPKVYNKQRTVQTTGADEKAALQELNNPLDPNTDVTAGKYQITVTTGPGYVTKRVEAAESMLNLINAAPQVAPLILDLLVQAQDWPMAEEIARRWRQQLPPGTIPDGDLTPEERQMQAQQQQADNFKAQLAQRMAEAGVGKAEAEIGEIQARTQRELAQAQAAVGNMRIKAASEHTKSTSTELNDRLAAISVAHEGDGESDKQGS